MFKKLQIPGEVINIDDKGDNKGDDDDDDTPSCRPNGCPQVYGQMGVSLVSSVLVGVITEVSGA